MEISSHKRSSEKPSPAHSKKKVAQGQRKTPQKEIELIIKPKEKVKPIVTSPEREQEEEEFKKNIAPIDTDFSLTEFEKRESKPQKIDTPQKNPNTSPFQGHTEEPVPEDVEDIHGKDGLAVESKENEGKPRISVEEEKSSSSFKSSTEDEKKGEDLPEPKPETKIEDIDKFSDDPPEDHREIRNEESFSEEGEGESEDEKYPILFLDVNLGKGKVDRLIIMDGDDPMKVADEFCEQHTLSDKKKKKLKNVIKQQLRGMLTKIEEDPEEEPEGEESDS